MRLTRLRIINFRSIRDSGDVLLDALQAFVGENNCGKSNLLRAVHCLLSAGAGGMQAIDFNDPAAKCLIEADFSEISKEEKRRLRPYLLGDKVTIRKELWIEEDDRKKRSVKSEYHGYQAQPRDSHLSISKIEAEIAKPKWADIAAAHGITAYVTAPDGKINKTSYRAGIERYLLEHDVEFDTPTLGDTQALGLPQNLLSVLPQLYLLPAITNYTDEIDRRSSTTVFRRLMADLADRLMKSDPRYGELETALATVRALLNPDTGNNAPPRLAALTTVEDSLKKTIRQMMPGVQSVRLGVAIEATQELFSSGVNIRIDDGVLTDVVDKGHGLQRTLVFSLLQMLIDSARANAKHEQRPIILAIEEPELYIHPHCQRLVFRVLKAFAGVSDETATAGSDQVIYTTHSPAFLEVWNYERIGMVVKAGVAVGTKVQQAPKGVLDEATEKKTFKLLTSFGLKHNEAFFSRYVVLVEGSQDEYGVIAAARKLKRIVDLPDEMGISIILAYGKGDIPKFQKVFNAFGLPYGVLLEMDGKPAKADENAVVEALVGANRIAKAPKSVEDLLGMGRHFKDDLEAKIFFSDPANINPDFEKLVTDLLPQS